MHTFVSRAARPWLQAAAPSLTRALTTPVSSTNRRTWAVKTSSSSVVPQLQQRRWRSSGDDSAAAAAEDEMGEEEEDPSYLDRDDDQSWMERQAEDDKDRTRRIPLETAMAYMDSAAYKET